MADPLISRRSRPKGWAWLLSGLALTTGTAVPALYTASHWKEVWHILHLGVCARPEVVAKLTAAKQSTVHAMLQMLASTATQRVMNIQIADTVFLLLWTCLWATKKWTNAAVSRQVQQLTYRNTLHSKVPSPYSNNNKFCQVLH